MNSRPITVTIIAILLLLAGVFSLLGDAINFRTHIAGHDILSIVCVHLLAIAAGAFLLRGRNWARWLAVAWMAFHVAISFGHRPQQIIVHTAFLLLFAWFLFFTAEARAWFSRTRTPA